MKKIILLGAVVSAMLSLQSCKSEQTCTCTTTNTSFENDKTSQDESVTVYEELSNSDAQLLCETNNNTESTNTETTYQDGLFGSIVDTEKVTQEDGSYVYTNYDSFGTIDSKTVKNADGSGTYESYNDAGVVTSTTTYSALGTYIYTYTYDGETFTESGITSEDYSYWLSETKTSETTCALD